jgi:hypothetical protein
MRVAPKGSVAYVRLAPTPIYIFKKAYLYIPPPIRSVHFRIKSTFPAFISIHTLRGEGHMGGKAGPGEEKPDAIQWVTVIENDRFIGGAIRGIDES